MMEIPNSASNDIETLRSNGWFFDNETEKISGPLPGLNILKISMLNKKFRAKIEEVFAPNGLYCLQKYSETVNFMGMLGVSPTFCSKNLKFPPFFNRFYQPLDLLSQILANK